MGSGATRAGARCLTELVGKARQALRPSKRRDRATADIPRTRRDAMPFGEPQRPLGAALCFGAVKTAPALRTTAVS